MSETKRCPKCKETRPVSGFWKAKKNKDGLQVHCIVCMNEYRRNNHYDVKKRMNTWYHERGWEVRICNTYKLPMGWYDKTLASQGGECAVCPNKPTASKRLVVDHDHNCCPSYPTCGKCTRGLLCSACNVSLGHLERPSWRTKADEYIERYKR